MTRSAAGWSPTAGKGRRGRGKEFKEFSSSLSLFRSAQTDVVCKQPEERGKETKFHSASG